MAKTIAKTKQYPKLIEALEKLERNGIIYNAGSGYTEGDAIADLSEKLHKFTPDARKKVWGYCLYHEQDAARALRSKFLMISFGSLDDKPPTILKVGEAVSAALRDQGFEVEWNGSVHERIRVDPYG
ncbi:MAG TPA: hypothetical protein VGR35_19335 [Tepidisphaeraceae bacterium]|nr:hypothetical protein [Tepidisphaeraceae bacterium]